MHIIFKNNKCPICDSEISRKEYVENNILSEYYLTCKNECCTEEFMYGSYRFIIFQKEEFKWIWGHSISDESLEKIENEISEAIDYWTYNDRYLVELLIK